MQLISVINSIVLYIIMSVNVISVIIRSIRYVCYWIRDRINWNGLKHVESIWSTANVLKGDSN